LFIVCGVALRSSWVRLSKRRIPSLHMECAYERFLLQIGEQHRTFVSQAALAVVETLKLENQRLAEEVLQLKVALSAVRRKAPPLPPPPGYVPEVLLNAKLQRPATAEPIKSMAAWEPLPARSACEKQLGLRQVAKESKQATPVSKACPEQSEAAIPGIVSPEEVHHNGASLEPVSRAPSEVMPLDRTKRQRERRRLRQMLGLKGPDACVSVDNLLVALKSRKPEVHLSHRRLREIMGELIRIQKKTNHVDVSSMLEAENQLALLSLMELIWMPNLINFVKPEFVRDIQSVMLALRNPTVDEIVVDASKSRSSCPSQESLATARPWDYHLNIIVSCVVCVNMVAIGISIDRHPEHIGWLVLEIACVAVFLGEMAIKINHYGASEYFRGELSTWNWCDMIVTAISVLEVGLSIADLTSSGVNEGSQVATAARTAVILRGLRFARVLRFSKVVNSPLLRDLANMLVGFVIGVPSLFWVLLFFLLILCVVGFAFRLMFGPLPGQDLISICGNPDDMVPFNDQECPVSWMYGEEFFGTVSKSMFTSFRFMLGDYSTRGGKSIVVAFSQDYGMKFDVIFVAWMIIVIFGLFNIVTAIFVDTTVAGLKHNDVKKKYVQQHENRYVRSKLKAILERIQLLTQAHRDLTVETGNSCYSSQDCDVFDLIEEEFVEVMKDDKIQALMQDLDIEVFNLAGVFYTFDGNVSGRVTLRDLAEGVMKLRGAPQKSDLMGCLVSTRSLHEKFDQLKLQMQVQTTAARKGGNNDS